MAKKNHGGSGNNGGHSTTKGHVPPDSVPESGAEQTETADPATGEQTDPYTEDATPEPPVDTLAALILRLESKPTDADVHQSTVMLAGFKGEYIEAQARVASAEAALDSAEAALEVASTPIAAIVRARGAKKVEIGGEYYFPAIDNKTKILGLRQVRTVTEHL